MTKPSMQKKKLTIDNHKHDYYIDSGGSELCKSCGFLRSTIIALAPQAEGIAEWEEKLKEIVVRSRAESVTYQYTQLVDLISVALDSQQKQFRQRVEGLIPDIIQITYDQKFLGYSKEETIEKIKTDLLINLKD